MLLPASLGEITRLEDIPIQFGSISTTVNLACLLPAWENPASTKGTETVE